MDSGLGSDDEKRSRTKAQKQLQNEQKQLFSGCFIDATGLGDDGDFDYRRSDERRQGALIFRSSIPQYSMLQMPEAASEANHPTTSDLQEPKTETNTPHNSIVQLDTEIVNKTPVGFFVDLESVDAGEAAPAPPVEKKNIFSMTIDFNVPKREMPSRLSNSLYGRKKSSSTKIENPISKSLLCEKVVNQDNNSEVGTSEIQDITAEVTVKINTDDIKDIEEIESSTPPIKNEEAKNDQKDKEPSQSTQQFVRLSDLQEQAPRMDLFLAPRMSRSIPEKSWVESPLATFRSASYRSSPQPFQLESTETCENESTVLPPRKSVQRLGTDLLRMFLEEIGPDITIEVSGRKLRAHKCILSSRCQYFAAILGGNSSDDVVSIQGYSYAAVHFAMCHVYSGAAHIPQSISLVELAALSDMLGLEGLKEVVAHALKLRHCHNFHKPCTGCITGVVEVLPLTATYSLDELYQESLKWISQNFTEVWPSRTFANLVRELRDKCYHQHVVHMAPETVIETTLRCDKLLSTMPTAKWAESVAQLALQLADYCQVYLRQHYAAVLISFNFLALDSQPLSISQLEENFISAAEALKLDQACHSYINCNKILKKNWSPTFVNLLRKIYSRIESSMVRQIDQASRSAIWMQLDPSLRRRIRDLSASTIKKTQTRVDSSKLASSSSDSSRNSSPAIKNAQQVQGHSPSLRRSLLIAARSANTPSSPSTFRRSSTLTKPTQSSAAKNTVKAQSSPGSTKNVIKSTGTSKEHTKRVSTTGNVALRPVQPKRPISSNTSSTSINSKIALKKLDNTKKTSVIKKPNSSLEQKKKIASTNNTSTNKPEKNSPLVQRSGTFLKDEPTVLGKIV